MIPGFKKCTKENKVENLKEKQMSNTQVKLDQVTKDIALLQNEAAELAQKVKDEQVYVPQPGDVVKTKYGNKRIIVSDYLGGNIQSIQLDGKHIAVDSPVSQDHFNSYEYKKIGELSDFIK